MFVYGCITIFICWICVCICVYVFVVCRKEVSKIEKPTATTIITLRQCRVCMRVANFSTQTHTDFDFDFNLEAIRKSCVVYCYTLPSPAATTVVIVFAAAATAARELLCRELRILRKWKEKRRSKT